jgi:catechol-2,3-dioxygenase
MPLKDVQNLGYVILLCNDLVKMRDFYQDILGLKINDETEDWVEIRIGSTLLSLRPRGRWYDGSLSDEGHRYNYLFR